MPKCSGNAASALYTSEAALASVVYLTDHVSATREGNFGYRISTYHPITVGLEERVELVCDEGPKLSLGDDGLWNER